MRRKRMSVLEWESMVNTLAVTNQENKHMDVMNNDSIASNIYYEIQCESRGRT